MFCNFISIDYNTYRCLICGSVVSVYDGMAPTLPCLGAGPDVSKHNLADDTEIDRRYNICSTCEFFKDNTCSQCGCIISRHKNYMNKLNNKDAYCPIDKW